MRGHPNLRYPPHTCHHPTTPTKNTPHKAHTHAHNTSPQQHNHPYPSPFPPRARVTPLPRPRVFPAAAPLAPRRAPHIVARSSANDLDEIALLEKALSLAKDRAARAKEVAAAPSPSAGGYTGPGFTVKTFNAISPVGLQRFPAGKYVVSGDESKLPLSPMAIMLRSHQLKVGICDFAGFCQSFCHFFPVIC